MGDRPEAPAGDTDEQAVERLNEAYRRIRAQIARVVVGQDEVLEQLLICVFARGHAILEGVPGLAKTLMVSTLARSLSLSFSRIQFTPDLMPSDITGTEVIQENRADGTRELVFVRGPVFANVVLADEINRTPPKTQAALLEAMQERQVTAAGRRHPLPAPFFVLATQNPIEQEGTYPLPEAQQDRFMFKILVSYPSWEEEYEVMQLASRVDEPEVAPVLGAQEILALQRLVRRVPIADHVVHHAMRLARSTRVGEEGGTPQFVRQWIRWGIGPRACQFMILAGKARAVLHGRPYVSVEDINAVAKPVMRHRLLTTFTATSEGVTPDAIVERLIQLADSEKGPLASDERIRKILGPRGAEPDRGA